eukprot:36134-Prorocentrum_minimum.AAC.1
MVERSTSRGKLPLDTKSPPPAEGKPSSVMWQGIYVEYSAEDSKCCTLNGIRVSTVDNGAA